jgi:hypothetical protein
VINRPQTKGCDHGSDSVHLKVEPRRRLPMAAARVADPAKSIRRIFEYKGWFFTSWESGIVTFQATMINEKAKTGI